MPHLTDTMHQRKVDMTLRERHDILRLLARLKQEQIAPEEMEEIGKTLRNSGRRALQPLVRNLWQEQVGNLISRYIYILEFFEDHAWIDQLIQIALKRKDLDKDAKAAILAALHDNGIDVSHPPFSILFAGIGTTADIFSPELLDRGEDGLVDFLEDFLQCPREVQLIVINQLATVNDWRVILLLEVLLRLQGAEEVVSAVITVLGRIRHPRSAQALQQYLLSCSAPLVEAAKRSLRRLAFLGVYTGHSVVPAPALSFQTCCVSPPDGDGFRSLVFTRACHAGTVAVLGLQLQEERGIVGAWGCGNVTSKELAGELVDLHGEEGVVHVAAEYALKLLRNALYRHKESGMDLPAEFYVRSTIFTAAELEPARYEPQFPSGRTSSGNQGFEEILEDDFFSCWFMTNSSVYDFALEWQELEQKARGKELAHGLESILERFCCTVFPSQLEYIRARLLVIADLMRHAGRDASLVTRTVNLAASLATHKLPYHFHPFLRRYALESMDMAREALAEGYDLRQQPWDEDDD